MAPSRRRFVLQLAAVSLALGVAPSAHAAAPSSAGSGGSSQYDLKKQLETGLKARRDSEFKYIAEIVAKVEAGTLPRQIVDQAFLYSRKRHAKYPLVYFRITVSELAKKAGVTL